MTELVPSLPNGGKEREIFIAALQAYRDSCLPPELTPDCPFFSWTANGPACGEQCADLLALYGNDDGGEKIDLGGGIALVRKRPVMRRPRRGPSATDRPFDARQIFMDDEHRAHTDRRTVALIVELEALISQPPTRWTDPGERSYDIRAASEQLEARDFDVEALIRYGIGAKLPMVISAHVLLPMLIEHEQLRPIIEDSRFLQTEVSDDWQSYFEAAYCADTGEVDDERTSKLLYAMYGFLDRIRLWIETADLDDIIMWRVPPVHLERKDDNKEETYKSDRAMSAKWAVDRFTMSYVADWANSSLHLEWLYLHGRRPGPCSPAAMAERRINSAEIDSAIAKETTDEWVRRSGAEESASTASGFINVAAGHLRDKNPELAAAIFDALVQVDPNDGYALNNYGFCLIALDVPAALEVLERANEKLKGQYLVNLANRVLALHLLSRNEEAYALGISEYARSLPSDTGLMWLINQDEEVELSDWIDVRSYLNTLVSHIDTCHREIRPSAILPPADS